jgi:phage terminase large subunit-like protein
LEDLSIQGRPAKWAAQAISAFNKYKANVIVAEKNNGGDMVTSTIHNVDSNIPVIPVWASRGKHTRAEPISLLYEKGQVHHVGTFMFLEDQLCEWEPGDESPDRLDACVWALTYLSEKRQNQASPLKNQEKNSRAFNLPT